MNSQAKHMTIAKLGILQKLGNPPHHLSNVDEDKLQVKATNEIRKEHLQLPLKPTKAVKLRLH